MKSIENAAPEICGKRTEWLVRFMTYNVYGYSNKTAHTTPEIRQPYQLALLGTYDADVVGFQEFSKKYRSDEFLSGMSKLGYSEVGSGALGVNGANYPPCFIEPMRSRLPIAVITNMTEQTIKTQNP